MVAQRINKLDLSQGVQYTPDTEFPESEWRICYRRPNQDYRFMNERTQELFHVVGIVGDIDLNWHDGGSHIKHHGSAYLDKDYVIHLKRTGT